MEPDDICGGNVDDMDSGDWEAFWESSHQSAERHFNHGFELVFEEADRFSYLY